MFVFCHIPIAFEISLIWFKNVCFIAGLWLAEKTHGLPLIGSGAVKLCYKHSDVMHNAMIYMRIWLTFKWILPTILLLWRWIKVHILEQADPNAILQKELSGFEDKLSSLCSEFWHPYKYVSSTRTSTTIPTNGNICPLINKIWKVKEDWSNCAYV